MTNLLEETLSILKSHDKSTVEIKWVGNGEYVISWKEFEKIADIDYDSGYGAQEIASDLLVVGGTWWLERSEYDGSEGWDYKTLPEKNLNAKTILRVTKPNGMWDTLERLHEEPQDTDKEEGKAI